MLNIADRIVGPGEPVLIVAEISCNHMGRLDNALRLIEVAAHAGADAVKFQTWMDPAEMAPDSGDERFRLTAGPWAGRRLYDLYTEAWTPPEWHAQLFAHARECELIPFSTPQSPAAVDFLETLDCPAYKVASAEISYWPLLEAIGATGKPCIASTGLANQAEIDVLIDGFASFDTLALLHCVSAYPAPVEAMQITRVNQFQLDVDVVGLSDHSRGNTASIMAVALGACILERHLMLAGTAPLDKGFSLTSSEFANFVEVIRLAEEALGEPDEDPAADSQQFKRRLVGGNWWRCKP